MSVLKLNSVTGIASISSNTTSAVKFYNNNNFETLGDISVSSINNSSISGDRNRIIRDMRIDQRNAGVSTVVAGLGGGYTLDRWEAFEFTDGAATIIRSGISTVGFSSSLLWTTTTADAALGASQFAMVQQRIEGNNIADLAWGTSSAKTVTLSFYVQSSLTGTFNGAIVNGTTPGDRSYIFSYTINAANTWEYKTVTIPGDTTGTWYTDNNTGMILRFGLGFGSSSQGTSGSWQAGNLGGTSGGTSVIGTLNATWNVTGVQLEIGSQATPFERRSLGTEIALCQRYYERNPNNQVYGGFYLDWIRGGVQFQTYKRALPSITLANQTSAYTGGINLTATDINYMGFSFTQNLTTDSVGISFQWSASAEL